MAHPIPAPARASPACCHSDRHRFRLRRDHGPETVQPTTRRSRCWSKLPATGTKNSISCPDPLPCRPAAQPHSPSQDMHSSASSESSRPEPSPAQFSFPPQIRNHPSPAEAKVQGNQAVGIPGAPDGVIVACLPRRKAFHHRAGCLVFLLPCCTPSPNAAVGPFSLTTRTEQDHNVRRVRKFGGTTPGTPCRPNGGMSSLGFTGRRAGKELRGGVR